MIDHVTFLVRDAVKSRDFYLAALAPLDYAVVMELTREQVPALPARRFIGLGAKGKPDFWLREVDGDVAPIHVAFRTRERATVDAFHRAALAVGATDHGAPGVRMYHPNYYGAFVLDPDGHNVEVVCHEPA